MSYVITNATAAVSAPNKISRAFSFSFCFLPFFFLFFFGGWGVGNDPPITNKDELHAARRSNSKHWFTTSFEVAGKAMLEV